MQTFKLRDLFKSKQNFKIEFLLSEKNYSINIQLIKKKKFKK
jgi:hypothetical protein